MTMRLALSFVFMLILNECSSSVSDKCDKGSGSSSSAQEIGNIIGLVGGVLATAAAVASGIGIIGEAAAAISVFGLISSKAGVIGGFFGSGSSSVDLTCIDDALNKLSFQMLQLHNAIIALGNLVDKDAATNRIDPAINTIMDALGVFEVYRKDINNTYHKEELEEYGKIGSPSHIKLRDSINDLYRGMVGVSDPKIEGYLDANYVYSNGNLTMLNQLGIHVAVLAIQGRMVFSTAILLQCEKESKLNVNCTKRSIESFQSDFVATEEQYHKKMKSISERCLYHYTKNIKKDVTLQLEPKIVLKEKYDPSKVGPESATKSLNELGSSKYSYLAFYAISFPTNQACSGCDTCTSDGCSWSIKSSNETQSLFTKTETNGKKYILYMTWSQVENYTTEAYDGFRNSVKWAKSLVALALASSVDPYPPFLNACKSKVPDAITSIFTTASYANYTHQPISSFVVDVHGENTWINGYPSNTPINGTYKAYFNTSVSPNCPNKFAAYNLFNSLPSFTPKIVNTPCCYIDPMTSNASSDKCCSKKSVGGVHYSLALISEKEFPESLGCKDGCVYKRDDDNSLFCFAVGNLPSVCRDE